MRRQLYNSILVIQRENGLAHRAHGAARLEGEQVMNEIEGDSPHVLTTILRYLPFYKRA